jgi:hypothetical protein
LWLWISGMLSLSIWLVGCVVNLIFQISKVRSNFMIVEDVTFMLLFVVHLFAMTLISVLTMVYFLYFV